MIASIFVIIVSSWTSIGLSVGIFLALDSWLFLGLHDVPFFAVQCQIKAFDLVLRTHPQPEQNVADLQDDQGAHNCKSPSNGGSDQLVDNLAGMTVHKP